jgi:ATP-binding cassette subfamily B protein
VSTATLPVWPTERAGEALHAVAVAADLAPRGAELGAAPGGANELGPWLTEAGAWLGVEVDTIATPYESVASTLAGMGPSLVRIPLDGGAVGVLAVVRTERGRATMIDVDLRETTVALDDIARRLCREAVGPVVTEVDAIVARAGLRDRERAKAADAMVGARLRGRPIGGVYLVRRAAEASPRAHARDYRLVSRVAMLAVLHVLAQVMWLGSWWAIGRSIFGGTVSAGWLIGWGMLLASSQATRVAVQWLTGRIGIDLSALLAQRLLAGTLRSDPDILKRDGIGIAMGRVIESAALQTHAVQGGVGALLASVEVVLAGVVLALGAGGALHVGLLALTIALGAFAARSYLHARRTWTAQRIELTQDLSEAMVGHATRLAQGDLDELADRDDRALVRYLVASRAVDRAQWRLGVLVPLGWPAFAAFGLTPTLVWGAPSAGAIAAALGGILFAADALGRLVEGASRLTDAAIAWRSIRGLFAAAAARPDVAPPSLALAPASTGAPALSARALGYRHPGRGAPVLAGADLVVERGDRVVLEGPSGTGKSTLASIIAGLRRPDSGLVLASGLDRASVGAFGWRRRVACAPQFHDNHVFAGPLLFNLLMGRQWPPTPQDVADAEQVCRELGLGPLIDRMPGGLLQQVGETGWQLSHGERSRVFLARALLQGGDVVLLDESLAALDPENLAIALRCIEARAPAAIVIAHP